MATATRTTKKVTAKPTVEPHTVGPYKANPDWQAAHAQLRANSGPRGTALANAVQAVTHLAWMAPTAAVRFNSKPAGRVVAANAPGMGIQVGMPNVDAMRAALGAAAKEATTPAQQDAIDNLVRLVGPPAK